MLFLRKYLVLKPKYWGLSSVCLSVCLSVCHEFYTWLKTAISPPIAYRFGWNFHSMSGVLCVTGMDVCHITCHITHHTSHITHHTCHKPLKTILDPMCDTILEMSPPQHQHGIVIHVTWHVMCHITHHTSHITCHKCHKTLENSPGPHVWHHFGNVTTPASTWDHWVGARRAPYVAEGHKPSAGARKKGA